ncbi:MAG TPA: Gfo/Idh/MocA family oxidoreductase [Vicinamibacteria bacterium]|nr:Gfo/Idh/MocA family oxidoreductase [Vicinamibacteria bacterium]
MSDGGRRDFLKGLGGASALLMSTEGLGIAQVLPAGPKVEGPPVRFGVVGCGPRGREILSTLARVDGATAVAACDTYAPFLKKGLEIVPAAKGLADIRALLDLPEVEAVVVATPTPTHREIALLALAAGKHLYCEAPLAHTVDDARAIARAARERDKQVFLGGVQGRSNALYRHVGAFVESGVLGTPALVTARWSRKDSWRRAAPSPERESALNWRLTAATSPGLAGEVGLHFFDLVSTFLSLRPLAVTGSGAIRHWTDKRDVADTVECIFEYPGGLRAGFAATLASSMGGAYTLFQGATSSLLVREKRAWMIKEADAPLLGWEVYARKETVLDETGIALIADATKILAAGQEPGKVGGAEPGKDALWLALEAFVGGVRRGETSPCGPAEAFEATAVALLANAAVTSGARVEIPREALAL